mmetsp:Transcript_64347/g.141844  ORF Transcript_64347/g.141844 Transcript_64347/m.141844 type:complete len:619 (+) Transcript_64347:10-1866(+)
MGSDDTNGSYHGDQHGATPLEVKRTCTDCIWLLVFFAALGGLGVVVTYAAENGDMTRLFSFTDYSGKLCGTGGRGSFAYFCGEAGSLDFYDPVCVRVCPTSDSTTTMCPLPGGSGKLEEVSDYPTFEFAGLLCMPSDPAFAQVVSKELSANPYMEKVIKASEIERAWLPLLISAGLAFILGFVYLFVLEHCACCLMWSGFAIIVAVPGAIGGYLIYASQQGGIDGIPSSGDAQYDLYIGCAAAVFSLIFLCVACCKASQIDMAIECVEKACACIFDMPTLLVEPLLSLLGQALFLFPMLAGFLLLISCGRVTKEHPAGKTASTDITSITGVASALTSQYFQYDDIEYAYIAYYVFMMVWVVELCHATSQFVVAYTVELWYFADRGDGHHEAKACFGMCKGFCVGVTHHFGTLLCGSFIITAVWAVRLVVAAIAQEAQDTGNPLGACLGKICLCLVDCFKRCLEFVNRNAYMDVAMNATNFCQGALHALEVITHEATAAIVLNGATWVFQIAGLGAISASNAGITWLMLRHWELFSSPESEHYVQDPVYLCGASAIIGLLVAWPFMNIFDYTADVVLFCEAYEAQRKGVEAEPEAPDDPTYCFSCFGGKKGYKRVPQNG